MKKFILKDGKLISLPEPNKDYPNKKLDRETLGEILDDLCAINAVLEHCGTLLDLKVKDPDYLNPTLFTEGSGCGQTYREYLEQIKYALENGIKRKSFSNEDIQILRGVRAPYIDSEGITKKLDFNKSKYGI